MVDVSSKAVTARRAVAEALVSVEQETLSLVIDGSGPKGDVLMGIQMDYDMARARSRMPEITATVRRIKEPTS